MVSIEDTHSLNNPCKPHRAKFKLLYCFPEQAAESSACWRTQQSPILTLSVTYSAVGVQLVVKVSESTGTINEL